MNVPDHVAHAIELRVALNDALPKELVLMLAEFVAVSELAMPELARVDATALRLATAREVVSALGANDRLIDAFKTRLSGATERAPSLRIN